MYRIFTIINKKNKSLLIIKDPVSHNKFMLITKDKTEVDNRVKELQKLMPQDELEVVEAEIRIKDIPSHRPDWYYGGEK